MSKRKPTTEEELEEIESAFSADTNPSTEEKGQLAAISSHPGWKILRRSLVRAKGRAIAAMLDKHATPREWERARGEHDLAHGLIHFVEVEAERQYQAARAREEQHERHQRPSGRRTPQPRR